MCLKMNFLEGLPRWFTWASIGLLDQCCEKGRAFQKSVKILSIVGDLNGLNGCWRAQHVSNHHRCFHVVANSPHQVASVLGCVTGFSFYGAILELLEFLSMEGGHYGRLITLNNLQQHDHR